MNCPQCESTQIIKYGLTHYGKPRFRCQECGRQCKDSTTKLIGVRSFVAITRKYSELEVLTVIEFQQELAKRGLYLNHNVEDF